MAVSRRAFLQLGGAFACCVSGADLAHADDGGHPFSNLTDMSDVLFERGAREPKAFDPLAAEGRLDLVMFMTQQKLYPECGGAFVGVSQTLAPSVNLAERVRPIIIFPKRENQPDPSREAVDNLRRALDRSDYADYMILTGDIENIRTANNRFRYERDGTNRAPLIIEGGVAVGHTLDAFLLTADGKVLVQHGADDFLTWPDLISERLERCGVNKRNAEICFEP